MRKFKKPVLFKVQEKVGHSRLKYILEEFPHSRFKINQKVSIFKIKRKIENISTPKIQKDLLNLGSKMCFTLNVKKKFHNLASKSSTLKFQKRFKKFYTDGTQNL